MTDPDFLDEEATIMRERANNTITLDKEAFFGRPLSEFNLAPVKGIDSDASLNEAITLMQNNKIGSVVCTKNKKVVGILTERDILMKVLGKYGDYKKVSVAEIMTKNPICLREIDSIIYAMNNMHIGRFRHIPIVDSSGGPISMISVKDVVNYFFNSFSDDISNTVSQPYRGPKNRDEGA